MLRLVRSRLAITIYLVGLAQFAVVAGGFFALHAANRRESPGPFRDHARFIAGGVEPLLGRRDALDAELARVQRELRANVTVLDPDGTVLASTAPPDAPRCARSQAGKPASDGGLCATASLTFPDGRAGVLEFIPRLSQPPQGPPVIPFVLVVVGVSSWLLALTLTQPLRKLSEAARAFGAGDLSARAALRRRDELGDVSRSFDEMADRVTELLRAERELLANVSHELRTPLARIRVALDLAAEGDAEVAQESLGEIAGDLDELERLISDILTTARLDLLDASSTKGIPPLRREHLDSGQLIEQAATRFRSAHPERALLVEQGEPLPHIDADPVLLRRVIDNLLENAHKYTEQPDAPIVLRARGGAALQVEVIDQGIGIASSDLPHVFRPFFRADKSRTRATGGLGLGLALSKRIVDAHSGSLSLSSVAGEGTRAVLTLPSAGAPTLSDLRS